MNDNQNHIGSNWGGGTPRTMEQAFRSGELTTREKISSVVQLLAFVAVMAFMFFVGSIVF